MNVKVPDDLQRRVGSEARLAGLHMYEYVALALFDRVERDRAAREDGDDEAARVKQVRSEATRAIVESGGESRDMS